MRRAPHGSPLGGPAELLALATGELCLRGRACAATCGELTTRV